MKTKANDSKNKNAPRHAAMKTEGRKLSFNPLSRVTKNRSTGFPALNIL